MQPKPVPLQQRLTRPEHFLRIAMVLVTILLLAQAAPAQRGPPVPEPGRHAVPGAGAGDGVAGSQSAGNQARERETVLSLLFKGGWLMIPIGLCSVVILTVALERLISLRRSRITPPDLLDNIVAELPSRDDLRAQDLEAAYAVCDESRSLVGDVMRSGLKRIRESRERAEAALEEEGTKQAHRLQRRLRAFSSVAQVAPLLGLLGTVFGMISCFERAAAEEMGRRSEILAEGIYQALVTTATGLSVAIPAMLLNYYFQGRVDRALDTVETSATEFLDHYFETGDGGRDGIASGTGEGGGADGEDGPYRDEER